MSKIKLTHKNKEYTLEYARYSARSIEEKGFNLELIASQPNKMIPLLLQGAFMKNHPTIKPALVDEIFEAQTKKSGLITALAEMYGETVKSLIGDVEEEDNEKNATWEIV
jgi:hypothetical protein